MYVLIGKEKCNQCNILDEKGKRYHYVDMLSSTLPEVRSSVKRDLK
jgi:hypothetical protein